jgi:hypothetical protein
MATRKAATAKAVTAPVAEQKPSATKADAPVMSAGVASDLEMGNSTVDPATGGVWERDPETGRTTHTSRTGEVTEQ